MMNDTVKKILNKIESNGFEAYVVGGYVRDFILNIESFDVDICTNALPKDIKNIFKLKNKSALYGCVSINKDNYKFDITTYRKDSNYYNRKPQNVEYINNLHTDLERRDFTINSLCMNASGNIIDLLGGRKDLDNKQIKVIGDIKLKFNEDPLRILRAIRYAIVLDFKLDEQIINFIANNKNLIKSLSFYRIKEELEKIMISKNVLKGFKFLKDLNLLDVLELEYKEIKKVSDILGLWAQIDYSDNYLFSKKSEQTIKHIREILKLNTIDNQVLFKYGLYISMVAGEILGYSKENINKLYQKLPIKNSKEIKISFNQIGDIINSKDGLIIKVIYNDIIKSILNLELKNSEEQIKEYIKLMKGK